MDWSLDEWVMERKRRKERWRSNKVPCSLLRRDGSFECNPHILCSTTIWLIYLDILESTQWSCLFEICRLHNTYKSSLMVEILGPLITRLPIFLWQTPVVFILVFIIAILSLCIIEILLLPTYYCLSCDRLLTSTVQSILKQQTPFMNKRYKTLDKLNSSCIWWRPGYYSDY